MHIDNSLFIASGKILTQDAHKTRKDNQINIVSFQGGFQTILKSRLTAQGLLADNFRCNPVLPCPFQGKGIGIVGNHHRNGAAVENPAFLGINQCL